MTDTTTTPTTTAQATVLTTDQVRWIESALRDFEHPNIQKAYPGAPLAYARQLTASHRALAEQVRVLRENEQERNAEIASAYRRIDKAIADLRQVTTTAHNALADDNATVDTEYVVIATGQIESDLSDWMATVGHDVRALAALEGSGE